MVGGIPPAPLCGTPVSVFTCIRGYANTSTLEDAGSIAIIITLA